MLRYVILHHETPPGYQRPTHWDFMLETPDALRTWALAEKPAAGATVAAEALDDHRKDYLTYEGPVAGDRGQVQRWDSGTYWIESVKKSRVVIILTGAKLRCRVTLEQQTRTSANWRVTFEEE